MIPRSLRTAPRLGRRTGASSWPPETGARRRPTAPSPRSAPRTGIRCTHSSAAGATTPTRGRFRAFLLAACKHFLANARDREVALKRGGGRRPVSIDRRDAEGRYLSEPAHDVTPERLFERRWALTLLDRALDQVGREFHRGGKGVLYDRLKVVLTGAEGAASYARLGAELGMTEDAVKKAAQRLRQRYREVLRELVAETVDEPGQVDDEIRALFAILAS